MGNVSALRFCLVLVVGTVMAQTAPPYNNERLLPQWLTGIIAVSGFLLLTFIGFLVKKVWCEESSGRNNSVESVRENEYVETSNTYETSLDVIRTTNNVESDKDNHYETCNTYETNLDVLRTQSRGDIYDNVIDSTADKATAM